MLLPIKIASSNLSGIAAGCDVRQGSPRAGKKLGPAALALALAEGQEWDHLASTLTMEAKTQSKISHHCRQRCGTG